MVGTMQVGCGDMCYLTDLGLGHLTLTTEQSGYQRLGGIQVAGGEERGMLLGIG